MHHDIGSKQVFVGDNFKENVILEVQLSNRDKRYIAEVYRSRVA